METADHALTASYGPFEYAAASRSTTSLTESGRFMDALQMDIDNIRNLFGSKYDEGIQQMLDYIGG